MPTATKGVLLAMPGDFDSALRDAVCWLELSTGECLVLPAARWRSTPGQCDEVLLARCAGPTLDVGCGPGRLTAALAARGVPALGVDVSPVAVRLATARGAVALRADVFGPLPGEGRWRHVVLADGNIGIGGDPAALLRRIGRLLAPGGTALVELEPPGRRHHGHGRVRVNGVGRWIPWAWLGVDTVAAVAVAAGLRVSWLATAGGRWFVELGRS